MCRKTEGRRWVSAVLQIPYRDTTPHPTGMSMVGGHRMADTDSMSDSPF